MIALASDPLYVLKASPAPLPMVRREIRAIYLLKCIVGGGQGIIKAQS